MLHVSALTAYHLQGARKFLACASYAATYVVGIIHIIIIIKMKCVRYFKSMLCLEYS
jgi:hypothetical protein